MAVMVVGMIIGCVGGIWLLLKGFQESALWGIGMLLIPLVSLIFVCTHWETSKKPFLLNILGVGLMFGGMFIGGGLKH